MTTNYPPLAYWLTGKFLLFQNSHKKDYKKITIVNKTFAFL